MTMAEHWSYLASEGVYYNPRTGVYAHIDQATKQWVVTPPSNGESSKAGAEPAPESSGWGGLMAPDELGKASSIPKYDDPKLYASPRGAERSPSPVPEHEPILRLVVKATTPTAIPQGRIAVFDTREGGIEIGRDRILPGARARLRVKEMQVSKCHACIWYAPPEGWQIVDLGSTLGTFLRARGEEGEERRLSAAKHASLPYALEHLSTLSIGETSFEVHIHPELPCETCQLSNSNQIPLDSGPRSSASSKAVTPSTTPVPTWQPADAHEATSALSYSRKASKERTRKQEMAALRAAFLEPSDTRSLAEAGYVDRSAQRRKLHPAQPLAPPPPPPPSTAVDIGAALLQKQGWTPGSGLGAGGNEGRVEPIKVEMLARRAGLGTGGGVEVGQVNPPTWRDRGKQRRFEEYTEG